MYRGIDWWIYSIIFNGAVQISTYKYFCKLTMVTYYITSNAT